MPFGEERAITCRVHPDNRYVEAKMTKMKKHVVTLMASAAILACGAIAASAQQTPGTEGPGAQQSPAAQQNPSTQGGPTQQPGGQTVEERMQERWRHAQREDEDEDRYRDEDRGYGGRMMGPYGHGIMGRERGWRERQGEPPRRAGLAGPLGRVLFALVDSNGDGKISLQEWQAAHERIFKAMDTDNDGTVDIQEMQQFMRGSGRRGPPQ